MELFSTEWIRSYIVLALVNFEMFYKGGKWKCPGINTFCFLTFAYLFSHKLFFRFLWWCMSLHFVIAPGTFLAFFGLARETGFAGKYMAAGLYFWQSTKIYIDECLRFMGISSF